MKTIIDFLSSYWNIIIATIVVIVLFICILKKHNNFINVREVFKEHFKIFNSNKGQYINYYVLPAVLAFCISEIRTLDINLCQNINIVVSILISMLFAMLGIISSSKKQVSNNNINLDETNRKNKINKLYYETYNSIIFEIIICIAILFASFIVLFLNGISNIILNITFSTILYYLIFVVLLNILIVLKRLKILFEND